MSIPPPGHSPVIEVPLGDRDAADDHQILVADRLRAAVLIGRMSTVAAAW